MAGDDDWRAVEEGLARIQRELAQAHAALQRATKAAEAIRASLARGRRSGGPAIPAEGVDDLMG